VRSRIVILAAIGLLTGCGGSGKPETTACGTVDRGVIPSWARTGFSEAAPKVPHVDGRRGVITAILFGDILSSPPAVDRSNKILWVSKDVWQGVTDLKIRAVDGKDVVERTVPGGPGPSNIDLPHAGCWHLTLRWADRQDTLSLNYRSRS